eukprot:CAMPEP_0197187152 /NCGR_PEP_ID=MMETSP1423-20130617/15328_1 /TAXON_ID=476441 /ORGANISM="Pseudo-nitzschia heimii, Strain UNC1101" /LENGTH=1116 /DNA_ID=CAMNT_0042638653 /DNA_START=36 /DNA_END=3383 /DNA_ORIENTATION=+
MVICIEEFEEEERIAAELPKNVIFIREEAANDLGFLGGSVWHYPEEEIEFCLLDEEEDALEMQQTSENDSYSSGSTDNLRMAMIENYIATHDVHDDDDDLSYKYRGNVDDAVVHSALVTPITECENENNDVINDDDDSHVDASLVAENKRRHARNSSSTKVKRRKLKRNRSNKRRSSESSEMDEQELHRFRKASLCVPFEYTTKLATFYIRRPYGVATVPEIFEKLSPDTTDEEYKKKSRVSSSETIQVAISVSADKSLMLLYGSAGVRYKTNPTNVHCDKWIDVPDVATMDVPLGYVNFENKSTGSRDFEYSLDEVLEEAMLVREQYCRTILSAALEVEQRQLLVTSKTPSPPSLVKSIVSTPQTTNYYYDGSNSTRTDGEDEDELMGRKLDFFSCVSPSSMTQGSNKTTTSQPQFSSFQTRQRKLKRRRLYRFFQRVIIVIGFYCCGIFLVANLSVVDYHRHTIDITELLPSSSSKMFTNNFISRMFFLNAGEQQQQIKDINGESKLTKDNVMEGNSQSLLQLHKFATTKSANENSYSSTSVELVTDERNTCRIKLKMTEESLQEQMEQNTVVLRQYELEKTNTEAIQREMRDSIIDVKQLHSENERLAMSLESEKEKMKKIKKDLQEQIEHKTNVIRQYELERTNTETIRREMRDSIVKVKNVHSENERLAMSLESEKENLKKIKKALQEQMEQNTDVLRHYELERTNTETLKRENRDAIIEAKKLRNEKERFVVLLEIEKEKLKKAQKSLEEQVEQNSNVSRQYELGRTDTDTLQRERSNAIMEAKELRSENDRFAISLQIQKEKLDMAQKSLQEQMDQNTIVLREYEVARTNTETLQREKMYAINKGKELHRENESITASLQIEKEKRRNLELKIRQLEIELTTLRERKSQIKYATASSNMIKSTESKSLEGVNEFETMNVKTVDNDSNDMTLKSGDVDTPIGEEGTDTKRYEALRQHKQYLEGEEQLRDEESSETAPVKLLNMTELLGENRSLQEPEDLTGEKKQLITVDELIVTSNKNDIQSIESFFWKSGQAKKGPLFPKVYRKLSKHLLSRDVTNEEFVIKPDNANGVNKIEGYGGSVKDERKKKLDHGHVAINLLGDLAKNKLQNL